MDTKGTSLSELKIKTPLNHHAKNYDFPPQYKGVQNEKFSNHKYPNMNVNHMNVNHPGVVGNHVGLNVLGVDGFDEGNNGRYSNMGKNEPNTFDNSGPNNFDTKNFHDQLPIIDDKGMNSHDIGLNALGTGGYGIQKSPERQKNYLENNHNDFLNGNSMRYPNHKNDFGDSNYKKDNMATQMLLPSKEPPINYQQKYQYTDLNDENSMNRPFDTINSKHEPVKTEKTDTDNHLYSQFPDDHGKNELTNDQNSYDNTQELGFNKDLHPILNHHKVTTEAAAENDAIEGKQTLQSNF